MKKARLARERLAGFSKVGIFLPDIFVQNVQNGGDKNPPYPADLLWLPGLLVDFSAYPIIRVNRGNTPCARGTNGMSHGISLVMQLTQLTRRFCHLRHKLSSISNYQKTEQFCSE